MADIKNITFDSQSGYQHLTFTAYSSSISGSNWVIDSTFTVKCDSGTSIGPSGSNRRGFTGTINGQTPTFDPEFFKTIQWNAGTYTHTQKFTIPYDSSKNVVAVDLDVKNGSGAISGPGTWNNITGYTMTLVKEITVSYNANGGTGTTAATTGTGTSSASIKLATNSFTRANGTVTGYKVTFNANGGTCDTASLTSSKTRKYTFSKWNSKADGTGTDYTAGSTYSFSANTTLYAKWTYTDTNGSITLPTPTRTGYKFNGWATSSTATSGSTGSYTPSAAITLYATWSPYKIAVTFDANGGTQSSSGASSYPMPYVRDYYYGTNYSSGLLNIETFGLTKTGKKTEDGKEWNTKADGSGISLDHDASYTGQALATALGKSINSSNQTITIYANWVSAGSVRIKIDGEWKIGIPWVKVDGVWKQGVMKVKIDGTWKDGI